MATKGKLVFFCGKMGAGKTTLSKMIARDQNAILLAEDEWLSSHYPKQINTFDDYLKFSRQIKPFVRTLVSNMLSTGADVVLDFPGNTKNQRQWFLTLSDSTGSEHEMIYVNPGNEKCLAHIKKRGSEHPERAQFDTEDMFNAVSKYFEEPSESEGLNITVVV